MILFVTLLANEQLGAVVLSKAHPTGTKYTDGNLGIILAKDTKGLFGLATFSFASFVATFGTAFHFLWWIFVFHFYDFIAVVDMVRFLSFSFPASFFGAMEFRLPFRIGTILWIVNARLSPLPLGSSSRFRRRRIAHVCL